MIEVGEDTSPLTSCRRTPCCTFACQEPSRGYLSEEVSAEILHLFEYHKDPPHPPPCESSELPARYARRARDVFTFYAQNHYSSSKIPLHFLQCTLIFFRSKKMEKARVPAHPCKNRLVQPLLWCGLVHTGQSASYSQQHGPGPPDFSRKKTTCANHRHFLSSLKCSLEPGGREGNSYLLTQWWVCMSNDVLVPGEWTECEVCF